MLFIVHDHYEFDDNEINTIIVEKECFICLELVNINEIKVNKLNNKDIFIKDCLCDGVVHKECLQKWIYKNKSCPICRKGIIEKNNASILLINYNYVISYPIMRVFFILLLMYTLFDFYLICFTIYKDYTYETDDYYLE